MTPTNLESAEAAKLRARKHPGRAWRINRPHRPDTEAWYLVHCHSAREDSKAMHHLVCLDAFDGSPISCECEAFTEYCWHYGRALLALEREWARQRRESDLLRQLRRSLRAVGR